MRVFRNHIRRRALGLRAILAVAAFIGSLAPSVGSTADLGPAMFDVDARRAELQHEAYQQARAACLAISIDDILPLPQPILGLHPTDQYGTDRRSADFAWAVMVLGGRSLAGDAIAGDLLIELMTTWAAADALEQTPTHYDPFFALKRTMIPTMVSYQIVADRMTGDEDALVFDWIDGLVRRLDAVFDGDVDHNNHRYLADLALMTWGSISRDQGLYDKGRQRYLIALDQARPNGSLPLETRRGARALWYSNIAVGEMSSMAQIARANADDLYRLSSRGVSHGELLAYLLDGLETPALILPYAVENYIPGPSHDYRRQDLGFTEIRGHRRHYMAWAEALAIMPALHPATDRLRDFLVAELSAARPLIDEYSGGNATCFWMQPNTEGPLR